jgi:hypothetical protein
MSFDYQNFFDSMKSGIDPYVVDVQPTITYKLVTGQNSIDPYRGSSAGRAYDKQFHIYTSELILLCSGEVLGKNPPPEKSLIGEYRLSGKYIDYDKIDDPTFQNLWRKTTGEDRHEFSQGFTDFLMWGIMCQRMWLARYGHLCRVKRWESREEILQPHKSEHHILNL